MDEDLFQWSRRKKWLVIISIYAVIACWQTGVFVADNLANYEPARVGKVILDEVSGALCSLAFLPLLLYFFKKVPLRQGKVLRTLPVYLAAWLVLGAVLTVSFYTSRVALYALFDLGTYLYGDFIPRMVMETVKQFFVFWVIYFIRLYVITLHDSHEQRLRASRLQQELTRSRLQTLQMQLNPHFLFNTLNVISSTMYDDVKIADTMIADLSDLLRQTLNAMNWEEHQLRKELDLLDLYFKIMKQRFREKLVISMDIAEETLDALVPGFILQPLVENSIRYSMEEAKFPEITIASRKIHQTLELTLKDNGPGIEENFDPAKSKGIGLSNAIERLKTLYGEEQQFRMQNRAEGGVCVSIIIPFHEAPV